VGVGIKYSGSFTFNSQLTSVAEEVEKLTDFVFNQLNINGRKLKEKREFLKILLLNLKLSSLSYKKITYSRDKNYFRSIPERYRIPFVSYHIAVQVNDAMNTAGFTKSYKAFKPLTKKAKARRTMTTPTGKLILLLDRIKPNMIEESIRKETIILRNKEKKEVAYKDSRNTIKMRDELQKINQLRKDLKICLHGIPKKIFEEHKLEIARFTTEELDKVTFDIEGKSSVINLRKSYLHRVFNVNFQSGGRFYGATEQTLKRELRAFLKIHDGKTWRSTKTLDFQALHVVLLYARLGIAYKGDPYLILCRKNKKMRKYYKLLVLMCINAKCDKEAIRAFRNKVSKKYPFTYMKEFGKLEDKRIQNCIDEIKKKHPKLIPFLFKGMGNKLMYIDSKIASKIMLCMVKLSKNCLCLHDGFITQRREAKHIINIMQEAFKETIGHKPQIENT